MSRENVELVRRYAAALRAIGDRAAETGRRIDAVDLPETEALMEEHWHPEAVVDMSRRPDGGIYRGPAGVLEQARDWLAAWKDFDIEAKEFLAAGDRVVMVQDFRGIAGGDMEVEWRDFCSVVTVRGGRFVHSEEYWSRAEALEAVGLRE